MFVINLCASTTPVALVQPNSAELKRYTFFVTRRREEGRERFRCTWVTSIRWRDAECLLAAVRDVYPAAWAGEAPSHKQSLRAQSVALAPVAPTAAADSAPARASAEPAAARAQPVAQPAEVAATSELQAPPPAAAEAPVELTLVEDAGRDASPPQRNRGDLALDEMSNVREVLADLADRPAITPQASAMELDPLATLALLEAGKMHSDIAEADIPMVTPEDTQTLRDIRFDSQNQAPPCFAVQLVWSVTPIDIATIPQLAIFSAYTLYHVEGNRQGRRWYGLRLGFFTDAHAAKQVAYYMQADYSAVVVVPVTVKERDAPGGQRTRYHSPPSVAGCTGRRSR